MTSHLTSAAAQPAGAPAAAPVRTLGIDGVIGLPTGDYGQFATLAFGGLGRFEIPMGSFALTGRGGAIFHLEENDSSASLIYFPIFAGVRYPIAATGLYFAGELGLSIAYASVDNGLAEGSETRTKLGGSLGIGMRTGNLSLQGGLFMPDVEDAVAIGGSVGFDLAAF